MEDTSIKAYIKATIIAGITLFGLIVFFSTFQTIEAGTVGVVKQFGKVTGKTLEPGFHILTPFVDDVVTFNTKKVTYETSKDAETQKSSQANYKDFPVDTNTKDGQQVDIYYTIRFSVDPIKANWVAQNIGGEEALVEKVVKTESRIWARNVPREYEADQLYTGNVVEVQNAIFEHLKTSFEANGLILDSVGLREIKFSDQYIQAIEAKQIAAVQVETEKNKAAQAEFQKQARITQAEGQAREQELQRATISKELLEKMWIEKWNGLLPTYMMGDSQALIQLPK